MTPLLLTRIAMKPRSYLFPLTYGQQLFLIATVPLVLAMAAISVLVANQSRDLAEQEIKALETQLIDAKKAELKNYLALARTAIGNVYGRALPDNDEAKLEVSQVLSSMIYGQDGYFFVFDYDGTNLVSPRQTELINSNWLGLTDANGVLITDELIRIARSGGGYHSFQWPKPSTGETGSMVSYVIGLQDWRWVVGTGIFIDDIQATVAAARAEVEARIQRTFIYILGITLTAILLVFGSGLTINIRERRLADAKLKQLTQRVFDAQEQERGRVARELHDGISQILVGVKYTLDAARRRLITGDPKAPDTLDVGLEHLSTAIQEVRRISKDLRPGVLDDLGLGPALKALVEEFSERTGLKTEFHTVPFRNRLHADAKFSLYRIAQEALTNVERHAAASFVSVDVRSHKNGATMRITDDGCGFPQSSRERGAQSRGLGLRNMQERIEQLNGTLRVSSDKSGTVIEAEVPLAQVLDASAEDQTNTRKITS